MKYLVLLTLIISGLLIYLSVHTSDLSSEVEKEEIKDFVKYIAKKPNVAATVTPAPTEGELPEPPHSNVSETTVMGESSTSEDIVQHEDDQDLMINNDPRDEFDEEGNPIQRTPTSAFDQIRSED